MSADDGHYVCKLDNEDAYGIFYYGASSDRSPSWYIRANALAVYNHPIVAILEGHVIEENNWTEYGLSVHSNTLAEAKTALPGDWT